MQDPKDEIVGVKDTEEIQSEEERILAEATRLAEEAEEEERKIREEIERITEENPNLVFEDGSDLIGSGVHISPSVYEWALRHGAAMKRPPRGDRSDHPTKKTKPKAQRVARRKVQKKSRKINQKKAKRK